MSTSVKLFCTVLATTVILLQESPQKVEKITDYTACKEGTMLLINAETYMRVDGKETSREKQVLWDMNLNPENKQEDEDPEKAIPPS